MELAHQPVHRRRRQRRGLVIAAGIAKGASTASRTASTLNTDFNNRFLSEVALEGTLGNELRRADMLGLYPDLTSRDKAKTYRLPHDAMMPRAWRARHLHPVMDT